MHTLYVGFSMIKTEPVVSGVGSLVQIWSSNEGILVDQNLVRVVIRDIKWYECIIFRNKRDE